MRRSEPFLPDDELKLDLVADQLEIKRLRNMGVLIPSNEFDFRNPRCSQPEWFEHGETQ